MLRNVTHSHASFVSIDDWSANEPARPTEEEESQKMEGDVPLRSRGWLGPVSGLLFFLAVVGSALVFGGFDFFGGVEVIPSQTSEALLSAIRAKGDSILNSSVVMLLGVGFLGVFVSDLRVRADRAGLGWPSEGLLVGGVLIGAAWLVLLGLQLAAQVVGDFGHIESVRLVVDLLWLAFWLFLPGLFVFGVSASVAGLRSGFHPLWLGVIGVLTALTAFLPWDGLFVFVAWVGAASVFHLVTFTKA